MFYLTELLPAKLQPYAKALAPLVLGVVAVLLSWLITGELNREELFVAVFALLSGGAVERIPNRAKPRATRTRSVDRLTL